MTRRLLLAASALLLLTAPVVGLRADEGWVIERINIQLQIEPDGRLVAAEALEVDFRGIERHGIFRDIPYLVDFDEAHQREYPFELVGVTTAEGTRHQVETTTNGNMRRLRIGDPDRVVTGKETYRIVYRLWQTLNAFDNRDELYWNAIGRWPVRIESATVVVRAPGGSVERVECFQGFPGSTEPCASRFTLDEATFIATRPLVEGEGMTVVAGMRKGTVAVAGPRLVARPRPVARYFEETPGTLYAMTSGLVLLCGGVVALWWRWGRDRQYVEQHWPGAATPEQRVPLFASRTLPTEMAPPDGLRPGQMGLLVDERADTLDVTATMLDLAVRGYLSITELPKEGWFGKTDWRLELKRQPDAGLLEYERLMLDGLFGARTTVRLSDLRDQFFKTLAQAKTALYADAVSRGWFPRSPDAVRITWRIAGILTVGLGVVLAVVLGRVSGSGLLGLPVVGAGFLLTLMAGYMPRRTAKGTAVMRRVLGFVEFIRSAGEGPVPDTIQASHFSTYLPHALAVGYAGRWARAFPDLDMRAATGHWYSGRGLIDSSAFSQNLGQFSSSVSSAISSTPGGSGSSGFSGGSSGGGGGGGGGGSW